MLLFQCSFGVIHTVPKVSLPTHLLNNTPSIIRNTAASQGVGVSWISLSETVFCMAAAFPPGVLFSISLVRDLPFSLMRSPRHVKSCYFRALLATELSSTVPSHYDCQSYTSSSVCQTSLLFYLSVTFTSTDCLLKTFPWSTSYSCCYIY